MTTIDNDTNGFEPKKGFEDRVRDAADFATEKLDGAIDGAADLLTGDSGKKIVGGAAIGAVAAIVLPISLLGGALLGAGYAAFRQMNK